MSIALFVAAAAAEPKAYPAAPAASTPAPANNVAADPAGRALHKLGQAIQKVTLENGLRIVMNVDRSSPTVAVCVTYDVGSRNEQPGRSGFAHLFEHMMFQGSKNVPKGSHFKLISARGGTLNGTTSTDRTNYFEMLPANELALGLWLEADRMRWLDVTTANFENQRKVVQEEYRMRVGNAAYMEGLLKLRELVFKDYWPYGHDAIGSMTDLDNAQFEWVKAFHDSYYAPNNAVLTIAGDFDPDEAVRLSREYFGPIPAKKNIPAYSPPELPAQTSERTATVTDQNAKTPGIFYAWSIPPSRTKPHYALELAVMILADGESSRLYQRLVRDRAIARNVSAWTSDQRGPDMLTLMVELTGAATVANTRKLLDDEIAQLAKRGPSAQELDKAKNRMRSMFIFGIESNLSRAVTLGEFEVFWNEARLLTRELDHYLTLTPADVQTALSAHVVPARRNVVEVQPARSAAAPAGKKP
jgi:predicted Zn-dependent peptidase